MLSIISRGTLNELGILSERNLPPENTALGDLSPSHQDMIFVDLPTCVSALSRRLLSPSCAVFLGAS